MTRFQLRQRTSTVDNESQMAPPTQVWDGVQLEGSLGLVSQPTGMHDKSGNTEKHRSLNQNIPFEKCFNI